MPIEIVRGPLVIRSWQPQRDAEGLAASVAESIDHIRPWLPWAADLPRDRAGIAAAMRDFLRESASKDDENVGLFIGSRVVGGSGFHPRIGPGGLEIGYWVHQDFVRRGIATTTSRALTDLAFTRDGIDRVEIHHDKANVASGGVPRALGFRQVREEQREAKTPQQSGIAVIWRVTRDEWLSASAT
jgi:RimJ/RimL family protein N-acetyltransferase